MKKIFTKFSVLTTLCLLLLNVAYAQNVTVKGKVTDGKLPIPGVGVTVKGTTNATVTNVDGDYSLNVPANSILVFSSIGFSSKEVEVKNQTTINVFLATSTQDLDQVVVVGYVRKER